MNNRHIVQNYQNYQNFNFDNEEIKKLPDKECCIVCAIIVCYNMVFVGLIYGLIQSEDMNGSMD